VFKFRTMCEGAEHKGLGLAVAVNDDRITRVGHILRNTSLDELPQLINVLGGEMSLVGPRPTLPSQVERYTEFQRRRLLVRPGLTGWAQINGRNNLSWEARIKLDVWYVEHRSMWLDMWIALRTFRVVLLREGLYGEDGVTKDLGERAKSA
jgi:lipopolysaccharide/colanic/teichoic acid biosynthesis glycosyltransferase